MKLVSSIEDSDLGLGLITNPNLTPGCLLGAIFMLIWGDWLGRRRGIISGAIIMMLGVVVQITSYAGKQPLAQFTIGRIITGVGNGMNTSTIPTYQAGTSLANSL